MTTIPQLADILQLILTEVAAEGARSSGFVQRQSKLGGAIFVQTLVLGWLQNPTAGVNHLVKVAAALGTPVTVQGLDQRFTEAAAAYLKQVLQTAVRTAVTANPVAIPALRRFSAVAVHDSTAIALPAELQTVWRGCGGSHGHGEAALKLQVRLDMLNGQLTGPFLHDGRAADRTAPIQDEPLPPGGLRIADLGYFKLATLRAAGERGEYWLSRLQCQTAVLTEDGERLDVAELLRTSTIERVDVPVLLGIQQRTPARLLAERVSAAVAAQRRQQLIAEAKRKGCSVSTTRLALADWTILVTNAPSALMTADEAMVLYRVRWQIELLFKLWKEHGQIDESRSKKPWRILCEVYAKLLAVLIQHWLTIIHHWEDPSLSLVKAAHVTRQNVNLIIAALTGRLTMIAALDMIGCCQQSGCRMNPRRKHPNTYQELLGLKPCA